MVCGRAVRDEGTSYHYAAPSKYAYPSAALTAGIEAAPAEAEWNPRFLAARTRKGLEMLCKAALAALGE
jgi:uridine phosphorylase